MSVVLYYAMLCYVHGVGGKFNFPKKKVFAKFTLIHSDVFEQISWERFRFQRFSREDGTVLLVVLNFVVFG